MNTELWEKAKQFHGHECPGLAIGFKACEAAIEKMGVSFSKDEEIVCVTENDACGVDAVQVITGCTFGKGNLIYRGTGKHAFTFFKRKTNESLRIVFKLPKTDTDKQTRMKQILNLTHDELFDFKKPEFTLPETARIFASMPCSSCNEMIPEHKARVQDGRMVCLDCFKDYSRGL